MHRKNSPDGNKLSFDDLLLQGRMCKTERQITPWVHKCFMVPSDISVLCDILWHRDCSSQKSNAVKDDALYIKLPSAVAVNTNTPPFIMFLVRELLQPAEKQTGWLAATKVKNAHSQYNCRLIFHFIRGGKLSDLQAPGTLV